MPHILMPYTVHLDHTLRVTPLSTLFAKGDSAAHRFELTIMRAGVQEDLTGCTVMCKFYRMADSTVVSMTGSVEDRKAVAVLNKACYDYIGRFALTIAIKNGEEETTVFYGDGYMHGQRADTSISGEYIIYDINTLLEKIAEIDASTQAANTATSNANTATEKANTATKNANTAADAANKEATNANKAANAANAAAKDWGDSTAANSYKLGGKAPEYYLQPRNLLDNSFWRRGSESVNQRGQTSYIGAVYGIDRWYGRAEAQKTEVRSIDITVTATGTAYAGIKQKIANIEEFAGETVTLAVYVYSTVGVAVGFVNENDEAVSETVDSSTGTRVILCTCTVPSNTTPDKFIPRILLRTTAQNDYMRCYWAALYEGAYTADTLPPYVNKGYAAELAECQQRFHVYATENARPSEALDCCPPMILAPGQTVITQGTMTVDGKTLYYNSTDL